MSSQPVDPDFMRDDRLPAIVECFNDRAQTKRRAKILGWLVLPMCPRSGKFGLCHPDFLAAWRQKTNTEARRLAKISTAKRAPFGPVAYGF